MPDNISTTLAGDIHANAVDLLRVEAAERRRILSMLGKLEEDLQLAIQRNVGRSAITGQRLQALLAQTKDTIRTAYGDISNTNLKNLGDVSLASAYQVGNSINAAIGVDVASVAFTSGQLRSLANETYFMGRHLEEYWSDAGNQLYSKYTTQMRLGMLQGEGVPELTRRLIGTQANNYADGVMNVPRYQAEAIVRTGVVGAANAGRNATYTDNADLLNGIQWVATLDDRVCPICLALDGLQWELPESGDESDYGGYVPIDHSQDYKGVTVHVSCRCAQIPVVKSYEELRGDEAISEEQAAEIDPETVDLLDGEGSQLGFKDWLDAQPAAAQDEILGQPMAEAYRADQLTLGDLTNQANRPLTTDQLLAKAGVPTVESPPPVQLSASDLTKDTVSPIPEYERGQWKTGGCWALVDSLKKIIPEGEFLGVLHPDDFAHVGLKIGGNVIDANGIQTVKRFEQIWEFNAEKSGVGMKLEPMTYEEVSARFKHSVGYELDPETGKVTYPSLVGKPADEAVAKMLEKAFEAKAEVRVARTDPLLTHEITKVKLNTASASNDSYILDFATGNKGVFKPAVGESPTLRAAAGSHISLAVREAAASDIADIIGMDDLVPATVIRTVDTGGKVNLSWGHHAPTRTVSSRFIDGKVAVNTDGNIVLSSVDVNRSTLGNTYSLGEDKLGFGKNFVEKLISDVGKQYPQAREILVWSEQGGPMEFWKKQGFEVTGEKSAAGTRQLKLTLPEAKGDLGSVQQFAFGAKPADDMVDQRKRLGFDPADPTAYEKGASARADQARAAAFDYFIKNTDRHALNWMVNETTGKIVLIDNGLILAANRSRSFYSQFFTEMNQAKMAIPPEVKQWYDKWDTIKDYLAKKGFTNDEITDAGRRLFNLSSSSTFNELNLGGMF